MSRYIVLREAGSAETLLLDKATLVATRLGASETAAVDEFRSSGREPAKEVEFAFSVDYRTNAPARMFYSETAPKALAG
jgi:hypothetical protein